jgi:hypothetical protein
MKLELEHQLKIEESALRGANEALSTNLEKWERNEFEIVKEDAEKAIVSIKERMELCF